MLMNIYENKTFIKGFNQMNKTLLLAGVAVSLFATNASAGDFQQYVSAKLARTQMRNDASNKFLMKSGNDVVLKGTIVDETMKYDVSWLRFAYGIAKDLPNVNSSIRTELEYGINSSSKENGEFNFKAGHIQRPEIGDYSQKMNISTLMVNTYYDYKLTDKFVPYIGAGIGLAHIKTTGNVYMPISVWNTSYSDVAKDTEDNFAWNLSVGAGYKVTENITADLGYRYTNYGDIKANNATGSSKYNLDSHELYLGGRYTF